MSRNPLKHNIDAMKELKFAMYKEAMKVLEKNHHRAAWSGGWLAIRAIGKQMLRDDNATDAECAQVIIERFGVDRSG